MRRGLHLRIGCLAALVLALPALAAGPGTANTYWAFRPLRSAAPPVTRNRLWGRGPIDAFVLRALEQKGLSAAPPAGRLRLLRRVHFDLLGLPPTPAESAAFLADSRPDAYEKLIDRLLASPQYGERWGRHWLDVARYADSGGFETDDLFRGAWRYRDYVIRSFNANKPFDRFIQEQVAGDELWPHDPGAVAGTGLYCTGPVMKDAAMMGTELENEWLTDAVDTSGAAFLGITIGCARCHDHKYDPLTQKDYYGLQAVFAASDRPYPTAVRLGRLKGLNGLLSDAPIPHELESDPRCTVLVEEQTGFRLFHRKQPLEIHRLARGELNKPLEAVGPAMPAALPGKAVFANASPGTRRAALARWLTAPENPLTARVLVNRVWGWHFGEALVRTPNDFGVMGESPTHPELLDWLAHDFITHGWNLKRLHRQILLSSTYRQDSRLPAVGSRMLGHGNPLSASGNAQTVDPQNRLLWHFRRRRLEGEAIRDAMLACSGTLNPKQFGPPVVPPLTPEELAGLFDARTKWPATHDASEQARRSVYLLVRRSYVYPLFSVFDSPELMVSCPRRQQTVVPTQALALLNSPFTREQAAAFAKRLRTECGEDPAKIAGTAWQIAFGRPISASEKARAFEFLKKSDDGTLTALSLALFNTNEFAYVD